jgi:hypothetical protein
LVLGYGIGPNESYYYLAASAMRNLDVSFYVNEVHNQDLPSHAFTTDVLDFRADLGNVLLSANPGHIQWYIDGLPVGTATDHSTFTVQLANGMYPVKMEILLADNVTVKTVESQLVVSVPYDVYICRGKGVTCSTVPYNGGLTPDYHWYLDGAVIPDATAATYHFTPMSSCTVSCVMTTSDPCTGGSTVTSQSVNITVNDLPDIVLTASPSTVCMNNSTTLTATVGAGSTTAMTYTWYEENVLLSTTTSKTYVINNMTTNATYTVTVLNSNGCDSISNERPVLVRPRVTPSVTITVSDNDICAGGTITAEAYTANDGGSPSYLWLVNGSAAPGDNSGSSYTFVPNDGEELTCVMTSGDLCATPPAATSDPITMIVKPILPPSLNILVLPDP